MYNFAPNLSYLEYGRKENILHQDRDIGSNGKGSRSSGSSCSLAIWCFCQSSVSRFRCRAGGHRAMSGHWCWECCLPWHSVLPVACSISARSPSSSSFLDICSTLFYDRKWESLYYARAIVAVARWHMGLCSRSMIHSQFAEFRRVRDEIRCVFYKLYQQEINKWKIFFRSWSNF